VKTISNKKEDINYTNLSSNQFDSNIFYRIPFNLYKDKNESNNRASYVTKIVNCMLHIYFRKGEQNPIPINLYIYISKDQRG